MDGLPFERGTIVAKDYVTDKNPLNVWHHVSDGYFYVSGTGTPSGTIYGRNYTYDPNVDKQIVYASSGGDPLPALDGKIHSAYRHFTTEGIQAIYDSHRTDGGNDQHRTQLGGWSSSSSIHLFKPGKRMLIAFSTRLDPKTPLPYTVEKYVGAGNYQYTMVMQIKSVQPQQPNPMFKIYEGRNGLTLVYVNGSTRFEDDLPELPRDKWLRIVLDVQWEKDDTGAYRWWGDFDADGVRKFVPLSPKRNVTTIIGGATGAALNIGPYGALNLGDIRRDYSNIEIMEHPASDPW
jgi:hypothetical protein